MKTNLINILTITILFFGCTSHSVKNNDKHKVNKEVTNHQIENKNSDLIMNNGKRWIVDDKMMEFIRAMEFQVEENNPKGIGDYKNLSDSLQKNITLLTSNCTMSGKAHDELHKWLVPFIANANKLSEAKTETEAAYAYSKIKQSIKVFHKFFE